MNIWKFVHNQPGRADNGERLWRLAVHEFGTEFYRHGDVPIMERKDTAADPISRLDIMALIPPQESSRAAARPAAPAPITIASTSGRSIFPC